MSEVFSVLHCVRLAAYQRAKNIVSEVFSALHLVAAQGSRYVRAGAAYQLAMLLRTKVPSKEIVVLFIELIGTNFTLLEPGLWSLQYLVWRDYDAVLGLCRRAMSEPLARKPITKILTVMWGHSKPGS